jgi:WD40 repeat protein
MSALRSLPVSRGTPSSVPLAALSLVLLLAACSEPRVANQPPNQPSLEALGATAAVGMPLRFRCSALDAKTALLAYAFDWGDGTPSTEPIATATEAGRPVEVEHAFTQAGTYHVRCRAMDAEGLSGPWSEPAEVRIRASASGPVLTVAREGEGAVRSVPDGITCGTACEAGFAEDSWVLLEATPAVGWRFSTWSGDCGGGAPQVQVLLRGDVHCVARFEPMPQSFTLTVAVEGQGDVSSTPAGVSCPGAACAVRFADGIEVTLHATPRPGWRFEGWYGDCHGPEREVRLLNDRDQRCAAYFRLDVSVALDWRRDSVESPLGLAWSPDGALLAGADDEDGRLRVWDPGTAELKHSHRPASSGHRSVAWGGPGGLMATGQTNGTVLILDPVTLEPLHTLEGHTGPVTAVAWSRDGARLATGGHDRQVRLWDTATWAQAGQRTVKDTPERIEWSAAGRWLGVDVGHIPVGVELHDLTSDDVLAVEGRGFAWNPEGDRFAVGTDGEVRIFAPGEGTPRAVFTEPRARVLNLDWSPDGRWLAVSDWGESVLLLDASTGALVVDLSDRVPPNGYTDLRFHPTRPELAVATGYPAEVSVLTLDAAAGTARRRELTSHPFAAMVAAWSPAGDMLATGGFDGTVRLWGPRGEPLWTLDTRDSTDSLITLASLSWDAAGRRLATATETGRVHVWNAADGTRVGEPWFFGSEAHQVALSPDGGRVAVAGLREPPETAGYERGWVGIWDVTTRERIDLFREVHAQPHLGVAVAMTWSADGQQLLIGWQDLSWTRWDAASKLRTRVRAQDARTGALTGSAAFSPDGRSIVTWGGSRLIAIWDVASGALVAELAGVDHPWGLAWSPDGRFISGGSSAGILQVWETRERQLVVRQSRAHIDALHGTAWHPEGRHLTTVGFDSAVIHWRVAF